MKFTLEIELGNDAMQTCDDVGRAIREVAEEFLDCMDEPTPVRDILIKDINGNTVGKWEVTA
jgi:hypothetical protein